MNKTQVEIEYKKALKKNFLPEKDVILLEVVTTKNEKYDKIYLTSFNTNMNIIFNTGNFIKDFDDAIAEGNNLILFGGFENKPLENSYNSFSDGIFLSSTCDDFISDSKMYAYKYENDNIVGIKEKEQHEYFK